MSLWKIVGLRRMTPGVFCIVLCIPRGSVARRPTIDPVVAKRASERLRRVARGQSEERAAAPGREPPRSPSPGRGGSKPLRGMDRRIYGRGRWRAFTLMYSAASLKLEEISDLPNASSTPESPL